MSSIKHIIENPIATAERQISRRELIKRGCGVMAGASLAAFPPMGLLSRASAQAAKTKAITVGFVTSMSGPVSSLGIPYDQGIKAALAYKPDVAGNAVRFIALDDASDPTNAAKNARKLIEEDNVDILIGSAGSPAALAMATVAAETRTPLISIANANPQGEPGAWAITVPQPALLMIAGVVEHMKAANVKAVGYIGFSDAWGDLVYDALMKVAPTLGITVTSNERYARSDTSVTGQILKVLATRPDAVIVGGSGTPGALPYLALRERGYTGKLYGTHAIINPDFVRVGGAAVEGLIATTGPVAVFNQLPDSSPTKAISTQFAAALAQAVPGASPNAFSAYSFDAWVIFADAATRAEGQPGTPAFREALRDALMSVRDVVGTHGVYNFSRASRYGNDERSRVIVRLQQGSWQLVS